MLGWPDQREDLFDDRLQLARVEERQRAPKNSATSSALRASGSGRSVEPRICRRLRRSRARSKLACMPP